MANLSSNAPTPGTPGRSVPPPVAPSPGARRTPPRARNQAPQPNATADAPTRARRYPHTFWWYMKWVFITAQLVLFCAIIIVACIGKGMYDQLQKVVPDTRFITSRSKAEPTKIYAADGKTVLAEFKGEMRDFMPIERLKVQRKRNNKTVTELGHLINATLAIEDARFYSHPGMDAYRIAGAAVANFKNPEGTQQGGSTITEQLAVNIYLTRTKTLGRRLQTALLALQLEKKFSKDEILELYLNEIPYGNRAYGCEAAARRYFNKSAKDLTIAEAALMAGLPQQPSRLDPFDHYDRAKKRQRLVLKAMLEDKKINWGQYVKARDDESLKDTLLASKQRMREERSRKVEWKAPYFVAYVRQYLQKQYDWSDEFLNKAGLKIYTTLDLDMQKVAERVMTSNLNRRGASLQGAMVCIDPQSGRVLAMYGGRDYYDKKRGQFNRATQARRQPGSTFKPFIYATAMDQGYSPNSIVKDFPININGWKPKNYDFTHHGPLTFRQALGQSNNVAAVRIMMGLGRPSGVQNVIQKAHMMGITSSLTPYPSLALGASEITLLENTSAYGVFATRGLRAEATPITRVDNYNGETLVEQPSPVMGARVLSQEAGNRMWDMLRYVVTNGTGRPAAIPGVDVIGKTGTTSDNKDVWFMGATSRLVCGVWMGYDKPRELEGAAGSRWCAPAWRSFMLQALDIWGKRNRTAKLIEDMKVTQLQKLKASQYKKYVTVAVCRETGLLASRDCTDTLKMQFSAAGGPTGGAPTQVCDVHRVERGARTLDQSSPATGDQAGTLGVPETPSRRDAGSAGDAPSVPNSDDDLNAGSRDDDRLEGAPRPAREGGGLQETSTSARPAPRDDEPLSVEDGQAFGGSSDEVVTTICADSSQIATSRCPVTLQQFFERGQAPTRRCSQHR
jgi:penicillin-binding protein 1A